MRGNLPQAIPPALCVDDVHEPVIYEHDLDGPDALVRGSQDASATSQAERPEAARTVRRPREMLAAHPATSGLVL